MGNDVTPLVRAVAPVPIPDNVRFTIDPVDIAPVIRKAAPKLPIPDDVEIIVKPEPINFECNMKEDIHIKGPNGKDIAKVDLGIDVKAKDWNVTANVDEKVEVGDKHIEAHSHFHGGANGVGLDTGASVGEELNFTCEGLDTLIPRAVEAMAKKKFQESFGVSWSDAFQFAKDKIDDPGILKSLKIPRTFKNDHKMECKFVRSTGVGVAADLQCEYEDSDGFKMTGGKLDVEVAEIEIDASFYCGWNENTKRWKVQGSLECFAFEITGIK